MLTSLAFNAKLSAEISFNRDIRPILSNKCLSAKRAYLIWKRVFLSCRFYIFLLIFLSEFSRRFAPCNHVQWLGAAPCGANRVENVVVVHVVM